MSRCYGCCQENCATGPCSCWCHGSTLRVGVMARTNDVDFSGYLIEKCPCKAHRRYQAKRKPTGNCEACWRFFVKVNP